MKRRHRVAALLAVAALSAGGTSSAQTKAARPPNIVFVLVDDLRWDETGITGHPFVETPHIDRIGREGARFLNAFATTPLCSPSRATFLTGQFAHTNRIIDNTDRAETSHRMPTFPRELQQAGYATAFLGKWHMGNDDSPRPGFTHWVGMRGQGEAVDPVLNVDGTRVETRGYVTDILTDYAVRFIEKSRAQPFLVYLAHKAIHPNIQQRDDGSTVPLAGQPGGFVAAERHRGRYLGRAMPRRPSAFKPPSGKPALLRQIDDLPPLGRETATPDEEIRGRLEMLLAVDESVGRLLDALRRAGELDRTMFVFTSDHGYFYGEHGLSAERRLAYEETIRIPLLVRYPPLIKAGTTPGEMVQATDLAPTLLDLAGRKPGAHVQGRSLLSIFRGQARDWRTSIFVEYFSDTVYPRIRNMAYHAVRTDRHKYIHFTELQGMDELYDLQADPYEMTNIIEDPKAASTLTAMKAELVAWLKRTDHRPATPSSADTPR